MPSSKWCSFTLSFLLLFFSVSFGTELISGSGAILLKGPATKAESAKAHAIAYKKFRKELLIWLEDEAEISIDTNNSVQKQVFSIFLDSCRLAAKSETFFKGKELTLSYSLTGDRVRAIIGNFNDMVDKRSTAAWGRLQEAINQKDLGRIYSESVTTLFYAMAHFGPPLATPDGGGRDLPYDARRILQKFFDKMEVTSTALILAGKTGLSIQEPPTIKLLVDSMPFPGMTFTGRLQNGSILFSTPTDENGSIIVDNFKIPFVANGALLDIGPNPAAVIDLTGFIDPADLGIKLNKSQVQSFIFKITRPVYSLDYQATSVSNIKMPPDFAKAGHVKKFLHDSCFLQEKSGGQPLDLDISIKAQVSSYTYDATEEIGVKMTAQVTVKGLLLQPPRTKTNQLVIEKRYGRYLTVPYGRYFWEVNGKLREMIKATIAGL
jgi:hypothetical protein